MSPRSIAMLSESDLRGGAETLMLHLARGLRDRDYRIHFVGPEHGCGWLGDAFRNEGFPTHTFHLKRALDPGCVRDLAALARRFRIGLLHSHHFAMGVYGTAAAKLSGLPHVITMHGIGDQIQVWRRRLALRCAFRLSEAVVMVSGALKAEMREALGPACDAAKIIANGVPPSQGDRSKLRRELQVSDGELLIVAVGNCYYNKAHSVLLEALALLPPSLPWRLAIAGRPEEATPVLEGLIRRHGWEQRIALLGGRADVPDVLAAADLFAMPSLSEGLPMALLEAMSAGLPVVATNVGGIPEAVQDGREGLLVPASDPAGLSAALRRLLTDEDERRRFAAAAQAKADLVFSPGAMIEAYVRLYEEVASPR